MSSLASPLVTPPASAVGGDRQPLRTPAVALVAAVALAAVGLAVLGAVAIATVAAAAVALAIVVWAASAVLVATRDRRASPAIVLGLVAVIGAAGLVLDDRVAGDDAAAVGRAFALAALLGLLFHLAVALPDGAMGRRRWLAVGGGYAGAAVLAVVLAARAPAVGGWPLAVGGVALAAAAERVVARTSRRVDAVGRGRLQLVAWAVVVTGAVVVVALAVAALTGWPERPAALGVAASTTLPLAVAAGRYERPVAMAARVLAGTIVAAGMVLLATAAYVLIVVGFSGPPGDDERAMIGLSIVATALIAASALPAHRRLEAFANHRVHGDRTSPEVAVRTFASRMSRAVPMDELLLQLAETLRTTMRLEAAEIWTGSGGAYDLTVSVPDRRATRLTLGADELSVASRTPVAGNAWLAVWVPALLEDRADRFVRVAAVAHLGELLGLIVAVRSSAQTDFDEEQERVLADLARPLGLALHNVRLDAALQASLDQLEQRNVELMASRARIVASADESRRHIERNLHDGAQQHLVAMAVKLGLARQVLDLSPDRLPGLLDELRDDVQVTLDGLRELAHGIYPPLLRSRGLPEALQAAASRATVPTTIVTTELPRFDPDLEAAVYFCCLEAIQNAGKHAGGAAHVTVEVELTDGVLRFAVSDDGVGFDDRADVSGQGFVNMADRIGAMGGTLTVRSTSGAGTRVTGEIPAVAAV